MHAKQRMILNGAHMSFFCLNNVRKTKAEGKEENNYSHMWNRNHSILVRNDKRSIIILSIRQHLIALQRKFTICQHIALLLLLLLCSQHSFGVYVKAVPFDSIWLWNEMSNVKTTVEHFLQTVYINNVLRVCVCVRNTQHRLINDVEHPICEYICLNAWISRFPIAESFIVMLQ